MNSKEKIISALSRFNQQSTSELIISTRLTKEEVHLATKELSYSMVISSSKNRWTLKSSELDKPMMSRPWNKNVFAGMSI